MQQTRGYLHIPLNFFVFCFAALADKVLLFEFLLARPGYAMKSRGETSLPREQFFWTARVAWMFSPTE